MWEDLYPTIDKMSEVQSSILDFIDDNDEVNQQDNYANLVAIFEKEKNKHELKLILYMLSRISNEHHRCPDFFNKIFTILDIIKDDIKKQFTSTDIFNIFKKNKRILLYFGENEMIILNQKIINIICYGKFRRRNYHLYFLPEIKQISNEISFKKEEEEEEESTNFDYKRKIGENDSYICQLIRNDLIDEFIIHVNQTNLSLSSKIMPSIYETNHFLLKKDKVTLIEYAAFFGAVQIVKYLMINNAKSDTSLWDYAIHSNNAEMIHLLENDLIEKPKQSKFGQLFIESTKCYHDDISRYIRDNILQNEIAQNIYNNSKLLKYYNFSCTKNILDENLFFYHYFKYDYYIIVDFLLKNANIDVNSITSIRITVFYCIFILFFLIKLLPIFE